MAAKQTPAIFKGAREYIDDPRALEQAQATFNEEALYAEISASARRWYETEHRAASVLDLCSATGLSALRVSNTIPVASVTLVDVDQEALDIALRYSYGIGAVSAQCADAVAFDSAQRYDLVLMNSAYHHIEDQRKREFLIMASKVLEQEGVILVGEQFLPPYHNGRTFQESVIQFYETLLQELLRRREPTQAVNVIRRSGLYCWEGVYEYKTSFEVFLGLLSASGLVVDALSPVWVPGSSSQETQPMWGSFVVTLRAR